MMISRAREPGPARHGVVRRRIKVVTGLSSLVLAGCISEPAPPSPARPVEQPEGHRRMVRVLRQLAEQAAADNTYFGQDPVPELRSRLATLPPDDRGPWSWRLHRELGQHELRLGNNEAALEHLAAAYERLPDLRGDMPPEVATQTVLALAVAWLRQGEALNCGARHNADSCILPIRRDGVHVDQQPARRALRYLAEVLERAPTGSREAITARWLLNIAAMTVGEYPNGVPAEHRISPETFQAEEDFPRFVNIAPRLGIHTMNHAGGAVAEDFDGDGALDLMTSTSDPAGQLLYFHNGGDGTFSDRTEQAGLTGLLGGLNLVQADYDDDGDVDVLVLRGAWWRERGNYPNSLLRNNGDGTFTDVTFEAGLGDAHRPTQTGAWADYDNDGDLDLYVGNEHGPGVEASCQLYRNDGDGTFTNVAGQAGVENRRYTKAVVWADYDGDRFPDLYVSNLSQLSSERGANRLYRNNGDGTFTDVAPELGLTGPQVSFPAWFWDFDNDGALDLFVAGYGGPRTEPDVGSIAAGYLGLPHTAELPALYRGDGRGGFRDVAKERKLTRPTLPMGANFGDLDNDGFMDFYLGTGYPHYEGLMPNVMYLNREGAGFIDITISGGFGHLQKGHAIVFADFDDDGDQDVFAQLGGMYRGDAFHNALYENPGFGNHWIAIKLVGTRSNRAGVGARIRAEVVVDGRRRNIYKQVDSGGSFGANPLLRQHLGLGAASEVETLEIYWPTSDLTQTFHDIPVDRYIEVTEGEPRYRILYARRPSARERR